LSPETKLPLIAALQTVHKYLKSERDSMYSVWKPIKTLLISRDYVKQKKKVLHPMTEEMHLIRPSPLYETFRVVPDLSALYQQCMPIRSAA